MWLARTARKPENFSAVDRLCYVGTRGMGALEFEPSTPVQSSPDKHLHVEELVELALRCGIHMMESRILQENGRSHFMTRRFDRGPAGEKLLLQQAISAFSSWHKLADELGLPDTLKHRVLSTLRLDW